MLLRRFVGLLASSPVLRDETHGHLAAADDELAHARRTRAGELAAAKADDATLIRSNDS